MSNYPKIDILINNAGAQPIDFIYTKDELESYLEGNHLGPMALTLELMEYFEKIVELLMYLVVLTIIHL